MMKNQLLTSILLGVIGWASCGFILGGVDQVINGSRQRVTVEFKSQGRPYITKTTLRHGGNFALTRDEWELTFLRVKYDNGRIFELNANEIAQKRAALGKRGTWWIDDSTIRYMTMQEANRLRKGSGFGF
jgi:hypothetical protein